MLDLNWVLYARHGAQSPIQQEGDYKLLAEAWVVGRIWIAHRMRSHPRRD